MEGAQRPHYKAARAPARGQVRQVENQANPPRRSRVDTVLRMRRLPFLQERNACDVSVEGELGRGRLGYLGLEFGR